MEAAAVLKSLMSGCAMHPLHHTLLQMRLYPFGTCFAPIVSMVLYQKFSVEPSCDSRMADQKQNKAEKGEKRHQVSTLHEVHGRKWKIKSCQNDLFGPVAVLLAYQVIRPEKA